VSQDQTGPPLQIADQLATGKPSIHFWPVDPQFVAV
jgi:hypothetical protein